MPVSTQHPKYRDAIDVWRTVHDAVEGQQAIKDGGTRYLPGFIPRDDERYRQYKRRAYYLGVTGRTHDKFMGAVFRKPATIDLPAPIEYLIESADGAGQSLEQFGKGILSEVLQTGRAGILADYPPAEPGQSAEETAELRAYAALYPAANIINWREESFGGQTRLTLVVLTEHIQVDGSDEFDPEPQIQYRVLRLREGIYTVQLYDQAGNAFEEYMPRQSDGSPWRYIPFRFVGASDNTPDIDKSPLFDMATLNIAHYQITADHMENLHLHGQVTLGVTSSLSAEQFAESNPSGIIVGARAGHFLGETGGFHTATAPESSSLRVALQDKLEEMVSIGASLVQRGSGSETAEGRRIDVSSEHSVLDSVVGNVSEGMEAAIEDCALFMGADPDAVEFSLNRQFFEEVVTPQEVMSWISLRDTGAWATTDLRDNLRKGGLLERTDEEIDGDLANSGIGGI